MKLASFVLVLLWGAAAGMPLSAAAGEGRVTLSLDGTWDIGESVRPGEPPGMYDHRVPVPGLANLATPPFADVDRFDSREVIENRVRKGMLPESERVASVGVPRQSRNYFWYRTTFRTPNEPQAVALLTINKAQFGTAVWLNGTPIGEHTGCFTAGHFDLAKALRQGVNELVIRVGAHPAAMPATAPAGTDFEKLKWTPGIYDSVSIAFSNSPAITSVQVGPRVASSEIVVETELRNFSDAPVTFSLRQRVRPWKGGGAAAAGENTPKRVTLAGGETRTIREAFKIAGAHLWTPEDPFLYVLETSTGGDSATTRFGMREFRFDTPTRRAYLNGKLYFLRGSNITLHRFLEDPLARAHVWEEAWVRRLLVDLPKQMHWNAFRFCIGPVPQKWLDIADEAGLLIQYEYFIWTGPVMWHAEWDTTELVREYTEYLRDNWNHPSVVLWDACNETVADVLGDKVIPAVRGLDLSARPWDNGYNMPAGPDDPYEDHPYLFSRVGKGKPGFQMTELERMSGGKPNAALPAHTAHAAILNEYGWLWLNRDGSTTLLTKDAYDQLLGPDASGAARLKMWSYLLGGLTEFWRAGRYYAGVLHFVYLTCSYPGVYTSDHWRDVEKLELDPDFADYVGEAFKPLGVYVAFFQPKVKAGEKREFSVVLTNDEARKVEGALTLSIAGAAADGREMTRVERPFAVAAWGQTTYKMSLRVPESVGEVMVRATAQVSGGGATVSRRLTTIAP
jgi:beta-galactosidase